MLPNFLFLLIFRLEIDNAELDSKLGKAKGDIAKLECQLEGAQRQKSVLAAEVESEKGRTQRVKGDLLNAQTKIGKQH